MRLWARWLCVILLVCLGGVLFLFYMDSVLTAKRTSLDMQLRNGDIQDLDSTRNLAQNNSKLNIHNTHGAVNGQVVQQKYRTDIPEYDSKHSSHINEDLKLLVCSGDCQRLREYMLTWPKEKPKAVIYYLTQRDRLAQLRDSLLSIDRYFNARFKYPVVIFHERDFLPHRLVLKTFTVSQVFYQEVSFTLPDFLNASQVKFDIPCLSHIGYRHMCRFHAKTVYELPILSHFDYALRLDDDSSLMSEVPYDVFEFMRGNSVDYGYKLIHWDSMSCVRGLWPVTKKYIQEREITVEQNFHDWPEARMFYNNFELSTLSLWRSKQYTDYIQYIDSLGGIYYHRWGDAPIKSLAVAMFVAKNRTHKFIDVAYQHGRFMNNSFI